VTPMTKPEVVLTVVINAKNMSPIKIFIIPKKLTNDNNRLIIRLGNDHNVQISKCNLLRPWPHRRKQLEAE
jgi:hypothetical protein